MSEAPRITDPKALRALAHPLRWQLLEIITRAGTATATRCAQETGESVANCSYHLNLLAKYGYVEHAEGGQGREKPWRVLRSDFQVSTEGVDDDGAIAARAASGAFLDYELNQIRESHLTAHLNAPRWRSVVGADNTREYLTPDEVTEVREAVRQQMERFRGRRDNPELRPEGARWVHIFLSTSVSVTETEPPTTD